MNQKTGLGDTARDPMRRRRERHRQMRGLRAGMLFLGGMIVVVGLLLLILPLFRVQRIEIKGNSYYSEEELIRVCGIEEGEELLGIDLQTVVDRIQKSCPYVESVEVRAVFPATVRITVTERAQVMYGEWNGTYFSVDQEFLVLETGTEEALFSGFLKVSLPQILSVTSGKTLVFSDSVTDLSYIEELTDYLRENNLLEDVTYLDVASRFDVSYDISNRCRIKLGKVDFLEQKHRLAAEILELKGGEETRCMILDVSDPQKPTYRVVDSLEQSTEQVFDN